MTKMILAVIFAMAIASPVFANNGTDAGNGSHNIDNRGPNGENNCAGGGCGVTGDSHQLGDGNPGQGGGTTK
jgi:hypothetical protein